VADDITLRIGADIKDVNKAIAATERLEGQIKKANNAFIKGKVGPDQYNDALRKIGRTMAKYSSSYQKAHSDVKRLAKAQLDLATSTKTAEAAQMAATKASNRLGVVTQQAGYQVSDFIVQVQSGTNPFVAFSQQASQLAGVLPLVASNLGLTTTAAIAVSSALGIAIPLVGALGAAWLVSRKSQEDFTESLPPLKQALKGVREEAKELAAEIAILQGNFETASEAALENAIATMKAERSGLGPRTGKFATLGADIKEAERALELLRNRRDFLEQESQYYNDILGSTEGLNQANQALNETFSSRLGTIDDTANEYEDVLGSEKGLKTAVDALNKMYADRLAKLQATADAYDDILGSERGLLEAERARRALTEVGDSGYAGGRGGDPRQFTYLDEFRKQLQDQEDWAKRNTKKTKTGKTTLDPLGDLRKQLTLENRMLGQTEARQRIMQALGDTYDSTSEKTIEQLEKQINVINEVKRAEEDRLQIQQTVESAFEDGFMSMIDGSKSVTEAFKDMARQIIAELYRVMVVQRMVRAISGFLPFADGGVFSGGSQVKAFANGGVVGGPTYFPMSGGQTGLMGEAGPEAIMPLKRGKDGKLGVEAQGGGQVIVNQTINVSTGVQQTVRTEIKALMPQIAANTKAAVADAKRRGGSYGKAF
jgi:hypothetical protein